MRQKDYLLRVFSFLHLIIRMKMKAARGICYSFQANGELRGLTTESRRTRKMMRDEE